MFNFTNANLLLKRPNNTVDASIISKEQIQYIIAVLDSLIRQNIPGDVVEFGCYVGESSKYLRMILDHHLSDKALYVYDSFEGLPELSDHEKGTGWTPGTLNTTPEVVTNNFLNNGLRPPTITKGWFKDISDNCIPNNICFAFLDGDFYQSIYDSLSKVYPKLSIGGCIILHDYERPDLPGVKSAVIDYVTNNNINNYILYKIYDQLGILIKI